MKHSEIIVKIPEPCHEDWNNMSPTEKGSFCHTCTKEVIDFSAKSDEEIINYVSKNKNLCGRFHTSQLDRKLIADRKKRNHWLSYAATLLLPITLFSQETQQIGKAETIDTLNYTSLNISSLQRKSTVNTAIQNERFTITGTVKDDTDVLPGATVLIKGTQIGKTTDFDGNYKLNVKAGDVLVISYVGYKNKEIRVNANRRIYNALLELDDAVFMMIGFVACVENTGADAYGYVSKYDKTFYPKAMNAQQIEQRDQRIENYFTFQKKKWKERRAKRRAEKKAKNNK